MGRSPCGVEMRIPWCLVWSLADCIVAVISILLFETTDDYECKRLFMRNDHKVKSLLIEDRGNLHDHKWNLVTKHGCLRVDEAQNELLCKTMQKYAWKMGVCRKWVASESCCAPVPVSPCCAAKACCAPPFHDIFRTVSDENRTNYGLHTEQFLSKMICHCHTTRLQLLNKFWNVQSWPNVDQPLITKINSIFPLIYFSRLHILLPC